jgi:hypothetical protein
MAVLIYFLPDGQDVDVRFENGGKLEAVQVIDTAGKLTVELRGTTSFRSSSRTSEQDRIAASRTHALANGKSRQVIRRYGQG